MRKLPFRRVVLLACLGWLIFTGAPLGVNARPVEFSISIKLVDSTGTGWEKGGVSVEDLSRDHKRWKETTDSEGIARFYGLQSGLHHLHIEGIGLNDFETVFQISPDQPQYEYEVYLAGLQTRIVLNPVEDWITHAKERRFPGQDENTDEPPPANELFAALDENSDDKKEFDLDRIAEILKSELPADAANDFGDTPLMLAAGSNRPNAPALVKLLLKAGADPNAKNRFGATPLMYALLPRESEALKILIAAGAKPDQPDTGGRTALMFSALGSDVVNTRILLKAGANVDATDNFGQSPRDYAKAGLPLSAERETEMTTIFKLLGLKRNDMIDNAKAFQEEQP